LSSSELKDGKDIKDLKDKHDKDEYYPVDELDVTFRRRADIFVTEVFARDDRFIARQ
jgi:hypothetical protein